MKFGYLILRKISKFVATRCQIMKAKNRAKCNFGWSFATDPAGGGGSLHRSPDSLAGFKGAYF